MRIIYCLNPCRLTRLPDARARTMFQLNFIVRWNIRDRGEDVGNGANPGAPSSDPQSSSKEEHAFFEETTCMPAY
jgi:hypothetical protein